MASGARSLVAQLRNRELGGRLRLGSVPLRSTPLVPDAERAALHAVFLGFFTEWETSEERLLSYANEPVRSGREKCPVYAQEWRHAAGQPLELAAEWPLFVGAPELNASGSLASEPPLMISVIQTRSALCFHGCTSGETGPRTELLTLVWRERDSDGNVAHAGVTHLPAHRSYPPHTSWAVRHVPSCDALLWNLGDSVLKLHLGARPRPPAGAGVGPSSCWQPLAEVQLGALRPPADKFDVERWLPVLLGRAGVSSRQALDDYAIAPVRDIQSADGHRALLLLLLAELRPATTAATSTAATAATATPADADAGAPAAAAASTAPTAICFVLGLGLAAPRLSLFQLRTIPADYAKDYAARARRPGATAHRLAIHWLARRALARSDRP